MNLPILSPPLLKCDTGCARCWSNYSGFGLRNFRMRNALRDLLEIALEPRWRFAAYWQGALYIHCSGEFVSRTFYKLPNLNC